LKILIILIIYWISKKIAGNQNVERLCYSLNLNLLGLRSSKIENYGGGSIWSDIEENKVFFKKIDSRTKKHERTSISITYIDHRLERETFY
jgi:hypothetical protein